MIRACHILLCFLIYAGEIQGAGPASIATSDRGLWPYPVENKANFDLASRVEILAFVERLESQRLDGEALEDFLRITNLNKTSVLDWKRRTAALLVKNYHSASQGCSPARDAFCPESRLSWQELSALATSLRHSLPVELGPWYKNAKGFHEAYLYEQMRLAALFPRITSEILPLAEDELLGPELRDRNFVLSFDDGPTSPAGNTDKLIAILRAHNANGIFFLQGERLRRRLSKEEPQALQALYKDMCPASHGDVHKSLARLSDWRDSLLATKKVLDATFPEQRDQIQYFRPPYGQRLPETASFLARHRSRVMLWNIDSQDWNRKLTAEQAAGRVVTLMLLWRRGIILFHDVHSKAQDALPVLFQVPGVRWVDCSEMTQPGEAKSPSLL